VALRMVARIPIFFLVPFFISSVWRSNDANNPVKKTVRRIMRGTSHDGVGTNCLE